MINWQAHVLPKQFNRRLNNFKRPVNPPLILTAGFFTLIIFGTCLLLLPFASVESLSFIQAFLLHPLRLQ